MYLGIDFLVAPDRGIRVIEVNVGLPGGLTEYDRAHQVRFGRPSAVFDEIERIARESYGRSFPEYLNSLPFLESLKKTKIWLDGRGPLPDRLHPALRLEDKWVQVQMLREDFPVPETILLEEGRRGNALELLNRRGKLVSKLRSGRGGRGLRVIESEAGVDAVFASNEPRLLQEWIDSRVGRFTFSVRAVVFAGRWICAYANLAERAFSNHGTIAVVEEGDSLRLEDAEFKTLRFDDRSWEAKLWFGADDPAYLHHNLYEDEAAETALLLPSPLFADLRETAVRIERFYESLDFASLPQAWFEIHRPALP